MIVVFKRKGREALSKESEEDKLKSLHERRVSLLKVLKLEKKLVKQRNFKLITASLMICILLNL